jgi:3-methylcrotonyl-CoA carboxylase alpha subunit
MAQALGEFHIVGLATNIAFLKRLVEGDAFAHADLDTGLIERNRRQPVPAAAAAPLSRWRWPRSRWWRTKRRGRRGQSGRPMGQRPRLAHERQLPPQLSFADEYSATQAAKAYRVGMTYGRAGWDARRRTAPAHDLVLVARQDGAAGDPPRRPGGARHGARDGELLHVFTGGAHHVLDYNDPMAHAGEHEAPADA